MTRTLSADEAAAELHPTDSIGMPPDIILADYHLPGFDGQGALELSRLRQPLVPFLFVSGFIGEEVALESLKTRCDGLCLQT